MDVKVSLFLEVKYQYQIYLIFPKICLKKPYFTFIKITTPPDG